MKKLLLFVLVAFPLMFVSAETKPNILTLENSAVDSTIKYNGTIEEGSHAVMCKLYDAKDTEIDMLSSAVAEQKFEGSFTVTDNGKYKVACANYEGGDFKTFEVTVDSAKTEVANPKSFDAGVAGSLVLLGISGIGIATYFVNKKKKWH